MFRVWNVAVSRLRKRGARRGNRKRRLTVSCCRADTDVPDANDILWRERDGIRLVILTNPTPNLGAKLVKTVYRVEAQAKVFK
jgi:hypothetical protein